MKGDKKVLKELETLIPRDRISNGGRISKISVEKFLQILKEKPNIMLKREFLLTNYQSGLRRDGWIQGVKVEKEYIKFLLYIRSRLRNVRGPMEMVFNPAFSEIIIGDHGIEFQSNYGSADNLKIF